MKIYRKMKLISDQLEVGDTIKVRLNGFGKFAATVQEVHDDGYLFLFDECIAKHVMNKTDTNKGGYLESDLCRWLNEDVLPAFPEKLRNRISYISVPTYGQILDYDDFYENYIGIDLDYPFDSMKNLVNRIGIYNNETCSYWLQNIAEHTDSDFAYVYVGGVAYYGAASNTGIGVRPIFFLSN